jgi:hypothetical protein
VPNGGSAAALMPQAPISGGRRPAQREDRPTRESVVEQLSTREEQELNSFLESLIVAALLKKFGVPPLITIGAPAPGTKPPILSFGMGTGSVRTQISPVGIASTIASSTAGYSVFRHGLSLLAFINTEVQLRLGLITPEEAIGLHTNSRFLPNLNEGGEAGVAEGIVAVVKDLVGGGGGDFGEGDTRPEVPNNSVQRSPFGLDP